MLIDSFSFFNELDLLELRLNELYDHVDFFVLVEATKTQSGLDKPLYFEINKARYQKFLKKIIHVKVSEFPQGDAWSKDIYQRRCIAYGLGHLRVGADDIIMISDLDEIPKMQSVIPMLPFVKQAEYLVCRMDYHVYFYDLKVKDFKWNGTVLCTGDLVSKLDCHSIIKLRDRNDASRFINDGGWHIGYQGGPEVIMSKYHACVEPFDKSKIPGMQQFLQVFEERAVDSGYFIYCDELAKRHLRLESVPLSSLPGFVIQNKERFSFRYV